MKICLINSFFEPPVKGGAEVYTQELAEALSVDHEVTLISSKFIDISSMGASTA